MIRLRSSRSKRTVHSARCVLLIFFCSLLISGNGKDGGTGDLPLKTTTHVIHTSTGQLSEIKRFASNTWNSYMGSFVGTIVFLLTSRADWNAERKSMFRPCFPSSIRCSSTKRTRVGLLNEAEECRTYARAERMATSLSANRQRRGSPRGAIGQLAQRTDWATAQLA